MKDTENLWNKFFNSGRIDDYLKYRRSAECAEEQNVVEHAGHRDPGANTSGERSDDLDLN